MKKQNKKRFRLFLFEATVLVAVALLLGCSTVPPVEQAAYYSYKPDTFIYFGNLDLDCRNNRSPDCFEGMAVTKLSGPIDITFQSAISMDRVEFSTCSRDVVVKDTNWFGAGHSRTYHYAPTPHELESMCPLLVQIFSKQALMSWAMVYFRSDQSLPAEIDCNDIHWKFSGISACSTRAGLEEQISFKSPIKFEQKGPCQVIQKNSMTFLVRSGVGFCEMEFTDGKNFHDLILHGYKEVL